MLVRRGCIGPAERLLFERIVRADGRAPEEFHTMAFACAGHERWRTVHVAGGGCIAQYEAGDGAGWTLRFAEDLSRGRFRRAAAGPRPAPVTA